MSAYVVTPDHINVIVSWFMDYRKDYQLWYEMNGNYGYMGEEEAPQVAWTLYSQNVRSVNDKYNEASTDEDYAFIKVPRVTERYALAEIAGAIDCLEYQSCETDDYHRTDAYKLITSMRKELLNKVQARDLGDNTTWSIEAPQNSPSEFEVADRSGYSID